MPANSAKKQARAVASTMDQCKSPIRVSVFENGVISTKVDGEWTGIGPEYIRDVFRDAHCDIRFIEMPPARAWKSIEMGDIDIIAVGAYSPERKSLANQFVMMKSRFSFTHLGKYSDEELAAMIESKTARIGVPKGNQVINRLNPVFDRYPENRITESTDLNILVSLLKMGRIDVIYNHPYLILKIMREQGVESDWRVYTNPSAPSYELGTFSSFHMNFHDSNLVKRLFDSYTKSDRLWKVVERNLGKSLTERLLKDHKELMKKN